MEKLLFFAVDVGWALDYTKTKNLKDGIVDSLPSHHPPLKSMFSPALRCELCHTMENYKVTFSTVHSLLAINTLYMQLYSNLTIGAPNANAHSSTSSPLKMKTHSSFKAFRSGSILDLFQNQQKVSTSKI